MNKDFTNKPTYINLTGRLDKSNVIKEDKDLLDKLKIADYRMFISKSFLSLKKYASKSALNDELLIHYENFKKKTLHDKSSDQVRDIYVNLLSSILMPFDDQLIDFKIKLSLPLAISLGTDLPFVDKYFDLVDIAFTKFKDNPSKFKSIPASDDPDSFEYMPIVDIFKTHELLHISYKRLFSKKIPQHEIPIFIESVLLFLKNIELYEFLCKSELSRLKIYILQYTLLNFNRRVDVSTFFSKVESMHGLIKKIYSIKIHAQQKLSKPHSSNNIIGDMLTKFLRYLQQKHREYESTKDFETSFVEAINDISLKDLNNYDDIFISKLKNTCHTILFNSTESIDSLNVLDNSIDNLKLESALFSVKTQTILNDCKTKIKTLTTLFQNKKLLSDNIYKKYFANDLTDTQMNALKEQIKKASQPGNSNRT